MSTKSNYLQQYDLASQSRWTAYRIFGKRLFDLTVILPIFLAISPVLLLAAVLIKLDSRGPVFFYQERLGRYGKTFITYKFRTMIHRKREATHEILPGHSEVTRAGHWLRRFKIDEMPQLLNIVTGDMSLVGPRPALPEHINEYNKDGLRRLLERPGLTGLSQVSGNIYLSWPDRWCHDAHYVDRMSFLKDAAIIIKTVAVVLLGEERFLKKPDTDPDASVPTTIDTKPAANSHQRAA